MENYSINVSHDEEVHRFQVGEYLHHDDDRCKYRIYKDGVYVASFEPDAQNYLHICQNVAGLDEELLNMLAEQIEAQIPHVSSKRFNEDVSES